MSLFPNKYDLLGWSLSQAGTFSRLWTERLRFFYFWRLPKAKHLGQVIKASSWAESLKLHVLNRVAFSYIVWHRITVLGVS